MNTLRIYVHPQETWTAEECARRARKRERDGLGAIHPYPGLIAPSASPYPHYGQTVRYNGGCIRNDEWWDGESISLPVIPPEFEFFTRSTWGIYIRRKEVNQ